MPALKAAMHNEKIAQIIQLAIDHQCERAGQQTMHLILDTETSFDQYEIDALIHSMLYLLFTSNFAYTGQSAQPSTSNIIGTPKIGLSSQIKQWQASPGSSIEFIASQNDLESQPEQQNSALSRPPLAAEDSEPEI